MEGEADDLLARKRQQWTGTEGLGQAFGAMEYASCSQPGGPPALGGDLAVQQAVDWPTSIRFRVPQVAADLRAAGSAAATVPLSLSTT